MGTLIDMRDYFKQQQQINIINRQITAAQLKEKQRRQAIVDTQIRYAEICKWGDKDE